MAATAGSLGGKRGYRDHAPALKALQQAQALPPVLLVYGSSEYLLGETVRVLRAKAAAAGIVTQAVEAPALTEATVAALGGQASLFEPATLYLARRVEQAKSLPKLLALLPAAGAKAKVPNHLCLILASETIPAPLKAELERLGAVGVPCVDPWPSEAPQALQAMAEALGLKLKPDAVQLLLEANGADLVKQHNELARLTLLLDGGQPLGAAQLAPHLGMLREDETFQLDKLLLARQWAKAHALLGALLGRGEKALGLLGILASHCRTSIRVAEGAEVRLPPFVLKGYQQAIRRGAPTEKYRRTLALCQEIDVQLKSSRVSEEVLLGRVIEALAHP